jgi:alanine dehydrogenase
MRTGAAGALAVEFLTGRDVRSVGILGTGRIAFCLARACDHLFDLDELRCTSRSASKRDAFAAAITPYLRCPRLHMASSVEACLEGVDATLTAVPTPTPIIGQAQLAHVDTIAIIAGDSRTQQLQPDVLESRRVVVDLLEQAYKSGEFRNAASRGAIERIALARSADGTVLTVADAACGRVTRGGGAAYLTGMAAQDLCAAAMVYERLR